MLIRQLLTHTALLFLDFSMLLAFEHPRTHTEQLPSLRMGPVFAKTRSHPSANFFEYLASLWAASRYQAKDSIQESQTHRWHQCYRQLCGLCPPASAPCEFCAGRSDSNRIHATQQDWRKERWRATAQGAGKEGHEPAQDGSQCERRARGLRRALATLRGCGARGATWRALAIATSSPRLCRFSVLRATPTSESRTELVPRPRA